MTAVLRLTPRAHRDLDEIWSYFARRWNNEQADRYIRVIADAFSALAAGSARGRSADGIRPDYWRLSVASHVIFCQKPHDEIVLVVRVLHKRMDMSRHLY